MPSRSASRQGDRPRRVSVQRSRWLALPAEASRHPAALLDHSRNSSRVQVITPKNIGVCQPSSSCITSRLPRLPGTTPQPRLARGAPQATAATNPVNPARAHPRLPESAATRHAHGRASLPSAVRCARPSSRSSRPRLRQAGPRRPRHGRGATQSKAAVGHADQAARHPRRPRAAPPPARNRRSEPPDAEHAAEAAVAQTATADASRMAPAGPITRMSGVASGN